MGSYQDWDAQRMLDQYLYDYLVKKKLHKTAAIFREQANVLTDTVAIDDSAQGFLYDWWTIFYDIYASGQRKRQDAKGKAPVNAMAEQMPKNVQRNYAHQVVPQLGTNYQQRRAGQFPIGSDFNKMLGQPGDSLMAARMLEEQCRPFGNYDSKLQLFDVKKGSSTHSAAISSSYFPWQRFNQAQQLFQDDNRNDTSIGSTKPTNTTFHGGQKGIFPITRFSDAVMNVGVDEWLLNSLIQAQKHQPNALAQALSPTSENLTSAFPGSTANFKGQNQMFPKSNLNDTDAQNDRKRKRLSYPSAGNNKSDSANAEVDKPADEDFEVESFLSTDDEDFDYKGTPFSTIKPRSTSKSNHKGFSFEEVGCLHPSKSKVLCCHFSSDGKILASSGHEKKVFIWNTETFGSSSSLEGHSLLVTDVRFRPRSTILATSSFDRTVRVWDAAKPNKSLFKLLGHAEQVMSLDFHPRKVDLLCSCDRNGEIRLWNVNKCTCLRVSKGATRQVRFQPGFGKLLAMASGNTINIIDVEIGSILWKLKGHAKEVLSICWDASGKHIASVSDDGARVWSIASGGKCIGEFPSNGNKFQSGTFHPRYSQLLIVGGYQVLEFWNPDEGGKTWSISAHNGFIAALADSAEKEMIASASHDQCVKLWK